jgi:hypothetical protein
VEEDLVEVRIRAPCQEPVELRGVIIFSGESVEEYTLTRRRRYGSSLLGAVLAPFLTWWWVMSIPCRTGQLRPGNALDVELTIWSCCESR